MQLVLRFVFWASTINAIRAVNDITKWVYDLKFPGKDCHDVCAKHRWSCDESADWPETEEAMRQIADQNALNCGSFCFRADFTQAPVIVRAGQIAECGAGKREVTSTGQCIYNNITLGGNLPSLCDRKFGQRVRICPCIEYPITARKKVTVASTTAQSANDNQPPVTATARRLGVTSLATTTVKNTTTPLLRRVTTTPQPTKEKTVSDAPPKVKSIDLVLIGVIVAGSVSGFFFATVLISACICTCRNRAKAEARSRRRAEAAASRQHRSRRSGRRRKKKKKKRSRRSRSHHSSDDSPGSPGRRRREDLHREASSISVHARVIQMADADASSFAANPRAGPYNVNSELYGAETLTLTEMLESYNNFSY